MRSRICARVKRGCGIEIGRLRQTAHRCLSASRFAEIHEAMADVGEVSRIESFERFPAGECRNRFLGLQGFITRLGVFEPDGRFAWRELRRAFQYRARGFVIVTIEMGEADVVEKVCGRRAELGCAQVGAEGAFDDPRDRAARAEIHPVLPAAEVRCASASDRSLPLRRSDWPCGSRKAQCGKRDGMLRIEREGAPAFGYARAAAPCWIQGGGSLQYRVDVFGHARKQPMKKGCVAKPQRPGSDACL